MPNRIGIAKQLHRIWNAKKTAVNEYNTGQNIDLEFPLKLADAAHFTHLHIITGFI